MKIGIIGAVRQEVELLFAALAESGSPVRVVTQGALEFHEGTLDGCSVVIVCCGVGKVHAALCAQILISSFGVGAVINTGSAGGLAPGLSVLDMVVSADCVQHDFDCTHFNYKPGQIPGFDSPFFAADDDLRRVALDSFEAARRSDPAMSARKMISGRIASGDVFVADDSFRGRLQSQFDPACVEMEGAAVAQVCVVNKVPFVILRSISDLAGKDAGMSYDDFSEKASHTSSRVVREMLAECRKLGR
jgi:adenosylhomocysteine nucleosidase